MNCLLNFNSFSQQIKKAVLKLPLYKFLLNQNSSTDPPKVDYRSRIIFFVSTNEPVCNLYKYIPLDRFDALKVTS